VFNPSLWSPLGDLPEGSAPEPTGSARITGYGPISVAVLLEALTMPRSPRAPRTTPPSPAEVVAALELTAGSLTEAVTREVSARRLGPEDEGLVALARTLATTIDKMDEETRGRMLGQTSGQLLAVLKELATRRPVAAVPGEPPSLLDELRARRGRPPVHGPAVQL
jgi:hypothetical protein